MVRCGFVRNDAAGLMGEMAIKTNLVAARSFVQTKGLGMFAARAEAVLHGCAVLRFSLTCGRLDDELVRLGNPLYSGTEHICWSGAVVCA